MNHQPDIDPEIARLEPEQPLTLIEIGRGYPYTEEERAAVMAKFVDPDLVPLCSRCNLPFHDCEGHGSSPESPDNDAEEGKFLPRNHEPMTARELHEGRGHVMCRSTGCACGCIGCRNAHR